MKIGLLAYHAACNFGAFLQLLSTVEYVKKQGDEPIVINWVPRDFRLDYEKRSLPEVRKLYAQLQKKYYPLSSLCETDKQVAALIEKEKIEAVIIGSDAVIQHHPLRERIKFPCRRIVYIGKATSDRMYPNCFWGAFNEYLNKSVPMAVISGSSQDSKYFFIKGRTKSRMKKSIMTFSYLSVRDDWTQKMINYLTDGDITPPVTPDPVFAFNHNASHLIPSKDDILKKFKIPSDYILVSFKDEESVNQAWIDQFQQIASNENISCVKLPYADALAFGNIQYSVGEIVSPLEWYALIKYSNGYVGNNMHPIVSAITNGIPFFSFDNYGIAKINGIITNGESSKIYHILKQADLLTYRVFVNKYQYEVPSPQEVYNKLSTFDKVKEQSFASRYYQKYQTMMQQVYNKISHKN